MTLEDLFEFLEPDTAIAKFMWLILFLLWLDQAVFEGFWLEYIIVSVGGLNAAISLLLSSFLIILYFQQHKAMERQSEILEEQSKIQERQNEIIKAENSPVIIPLDWEMTFEEAEEEGVQKFAHLTIELSNDGEGRAENLRANLDILLSPSEAHDGTFFSTDMIFNGSIRSSKLIEDPDRYDYSLTNEIGGTLQPSSRTSFHAVIPLRLKVPTGEYKTVNTETPGQKMRAPMFRGETIGEVIDEFYFDIDQILVRLTVEFEDASGDSEEVTVIQAKSALNDDITIIDVLNEGTPLSDLEYREGDPRYFFERLYPPMQL